MKDDIGKKDKKRICNMLKKRVSFWILFIYILFVLWGQYALIDTIFPQLPFVILGIAIAYLFAKKINVIIEGIKVEYSDEVYEKKQFIKKYIFYFIVTLFLLTLYYIARYPGVYCVDSASQLLQAKEGVYNDWHPALYTWLAFTIPYKIFGIPGVAYVQILFFSIALAYMMAIFYRYGMKKKTRLLIYAFVMLNPMTGYMMVMPWKDSAFAILTLILTVIVIETAYTDGQNFSSWWKVIGVVIILTVCTMVRHNAILFTFPMMLSLLCISKKHRIKVVCISIISILLVLVIKGPLYHALDVQKPNQRVVETTGMCMVMMGNAYVNDSEYMSQDVVDFLEYVRTPEHWNDRYKLGDWNHVKWLEEETPLEVLDEIGAYKIVEYTLDTIARCPEHSIQAFFASTGMVWKIDGDTPWDGCLEYFDSDFIGNTLFKNDIEFDIIEYKPSNFGAYLAVLINDYKHIIKNSVFKYLFFYIGIFDMILLVYSLYIMSAKVRVEALIIILPIFVYNFGTALLLSGFDWRFFYYTFLCFFGMMFAMNKYRTGRKEDE